MADQTTACGTAVLQQRIAQTPGRNREKELPMIPLLIGQTPYPDHKIEYPARRKALERRLAKTGTRAAIVTRRNVQIGEIRPAAAAQTQLETGLLAALQQQHAEMSAGSLAGTEKTGSARAQNNDIEISAAAEALRATRVVKRGRRVYTEILDRRCVHVGFVAYEVQPCQ